MKSIKILALMVGVAVSTEAQDFSFDDLRAPSSPAFSLAGISPTSIERPSSAKAFGLSLFQASAGTDNGMPRNIAMEFSPYWWKSKPELTFDKYYNQDPLQNVLQSLTFSLATYEVNSANNSEDTGLGFGFTYNILSGKKNPDLELQVKALKDLQKKALGDDFEGNGLTDELMEEMRTEAATISDMDKRRIGWQLSHAGALTYDFAGNDLDQAKFSKFGSWLTLGYTPNPQKGISVLNRMTVLANVRYIHDERPNNRADFFDAGARLYWRSKGHPFALSSEFLHRFKHSNESDRLSILAEYKFNDDYHFFATIGKSFSDDTSGNETLSLFGISFGWGDGAKGAN